MAVPDSPAFICPHCNAYAQHLMYTHILSPVGHERFASYANDEVAQRDKTLDGTGATKCTHCANFAIWISGQQAFPKMIPAEPAHRDMPDDVRAIYEEAALVVANSPRAAAALLRLAVEVLCTRHLGQNGKTLDQAIAGLVADGLDRRIVDALDVVRVTGNQLIHPGQIVEAEDPAISVTLFRILNMIIDRLISAPAEVAALYASMPPEKLAAIERRDVKAIEKRSKNGQNT